MFIPIDIYLYHGNSKNILIGIDIDKTASDTVKNSSEMSQVLTPAVTENHYIIQVGCCKLFHTMYIVKPYPLIIEMFPEHLGDQIA